MSYEEAIGHPCPKRFRVNNKYEKRMNGITDCERIDIEDEDDVLDDPIRLWDSDERAVFCSYRFKNTSHFTTDRSEQLKELLTQSQDALDSTENLTVSSSNVSKCRPCSVQIVDCHKYPQLYEEEYKTKNLMVTLEEDITDVNDLENIRQYSFRGEDVEYIQDESKINIEFDTAERIAFNGGEQFVDEEICNDNHTLDFQVKRTEALTMEVDHGLGQLNNADQTFNGSKTYNNVIKSTALYEKHKIGNPKLASIQIDNYWSVSKSQNNSNKNKIESKKSSNECSKKSSIANRLTNKKKQIQNKRYSLSKRDYNMTNCIKFYQRKFRNINQNERPIRWIAPTLTDPVSEKVIGESVSLYHENCPYRSFGYQKTSKSSTRIIPHYHKNPYHDEERSGRKNGTVAHHQNYTTLKHFNNFDSRHPLYFGHGNEIMSQNKSKIHINGVNNLNNNMSETSQVISVSNNSGVERNSIYKYNDSDPYKKKSIVDSEGSFISPRPEALRSLDEERSLYQFNSSWEYESIFSPFFLTSLDCNIYDTSENCQNVDLFPLTSSRSMIYSDVSEVESISTRPNETYLEKYMNFLKDLNEETFTNEVTNNHLFEVN